MPSTSDGHQSRDGRIHADHARHAVQPRPRLWTERRPDLARASTPSSPTRCTRTSSASKPAVWRSMFPTASIESSSMSTVPPVSGGSTRPIASAPILAEGRPVVRETMDFEAFKAKYFRFWNVEDLPADVTFDKYQKAYFREKTFDVNVDRRPVEPGIPRGKLGLLRFRRGDLPGGRAPPREKHFSNTWKPDGGSISTTTSSEFSRLPLATPSGQPKRTGAEASWSSSATRCRTSPTTTRRGQREVVDRLRGEAFAGEYEPMTAAVVPLVDLRSSLSDRIGDLIGPAGTIPSAAIDAGFRLVPHQPGHGGWDRLHDHAAADHAGRDAWTCPRD